MTRGGSGLGLVMLVVSLVIGGLLFAHQSSSLGVGGGHSAQDSRPVQDALNAAATLTAAQADRTLSAYQAQTGTYAGADLSGVSGARLLSAGASSYCVEIDVSGQPPLYDAGPNAGALSSRPCT